jgi:hypothetical protein
MVVTMIGVDLHEATHAAVAIDGLEVVLGEITIRGGVVSSLRYAPSRCVVSMRSLPF